MPRIDPLQLLKCLSVLLSPEGGILSRDEVPRLVNLMTKFSKKLVSKCVYVLILKNTETSLVDMFMAEGGWTLIQTWLQDAAQSGNWDLVKEILGLLLITPVDVERLKMNCLPKLIKNLSRREDLDGVANLSNQIVQNWLVIVKGSAPAAVNAAAAQVQEKVDTVSATASVATAQLQNDTSQKDSVDDSKTDKQEQDNKSDIDQAIKASTFYKVSVKDGKQVIRKLSLDSDGSDKQSKTEETKAEEEKVDKDRSKEKSRTSSSSKGSRSSSSNRDKDKKKPSSNSSSSSSSSSSRSKSSSSKDKDRRDKDKDHHRHNGSSRSSKSSSSSRDKKDSKDKSKNKEESKEKQAEKDKDTLERVKPASLDKLGRIPKKSSSDEKQKENKSDNKTKEEKDLKKPTFSILNRKASGEERTKTVKVFNSKMRSTGLEEEVKPPPPRGSKKPTPSVQLPTIPPKRPSPPRDNIGLPPEKKLKVDKVDVPERPGAIKLIPPKPKRSL